MTEAVQGSGSFSDGEEVDAALADDVFEFLLRLGFADHLLQFLVDRHHFIDADAALVASPVALGAVRGVARAVNDLARFHAGDDRQWPKI